MNAIEKTPQPQAKVPFCDNYETVTHRSRRSGQPGGGPVLNGPNDRCQLYRIMCVCGEQILLPNVDRFVVPSFNLKGKYFILPLPIG